MDKKILKQLKSDYEDLEIKPSANLWDQIDSALDNESKSSSKPATKFGWWKYAAVILLLISTGTFIYYNNDFNSKKTDYIVKQNLHKEEFKQENIEFKNEETNQITVTEQIVVKESNKKIENKEISNLKKNKEISQPEFSESSESKIAINKPETPIFHQEKIENKISPVVSDTKKISYITANDLLLGNELDKSREKANVDTRKFGVIHLNKVLPKFNNVVVLGATVNVDPR